jgi:hypothetical protein
MTTATVKQRQQRAKTTATALIHGRSCPPAQYASAMSSKCNG